MNTHPKPQPPNMCSKSNRSRNMKFEYNVVYENSLDKIDVGLNRWDFLHLPQYKLSAAKTPH